jgi:aspartate racemase
MTMHTPSLSDYVKCIDRGDWNGVGALMLASAAVLEKAGADFLICPDNTIHQALPYIEEQSPLPWLHIVETVAEDAAQRGYKHVGLTGTRWIVDSTIYPEKLQIHGVDCVRPNDADTETIDRIIMSELVHGVVNPESVVAIQNVIMHLREDGCDSVVLGCTELSLVMNKGNSPLPVLDSTRLLARAALRHAVA